MKKKLKECSTSLLLFAAMSMFTLSSCMSDREYLLRKKQLDNQAMHPSTYELFNVEGPVTVEIKEGGKAVVKVPNQPFREIDIPDGVKTQADLVRHLISVGAISVLGWRALDKSGNVDKSTHVENNTVNNAP